MSEEKMEWKMFMRSEIEISCDKSSWATKI